MRLRPFHSTQMRLPLRKPSAPASVLAFLAVVSMVTVVGGRVLESQQQGPVPSNAANSAQGAGTNAAVESKQGAQPSAGAVQTGPETHATEDSARLLKLATDLKAEVDKTTKDTLSLNVIRKAEEIERLAKSVREKAKPNAESR